VENDLPDAVVETLLDVCRRNAGLFQRYFKMKAQWLGLPSGKLRRYDIYAPLAPSEKKFDYAAGIQTVMHSYRAFSPQVAELAQRETEIPEHRAHGDLRRLRATIVRTPLRDRTPTSFRRTGLHLRELRD